MSNETTISAAVPPVAPAHRSLGQVARAASLSVGALSRIVGGRRRASPDAALRLAAATGIARDLWIYSKTTEAQAAFQRLFGDIIQPPQLAIRSAEHVAPGEPSVRPVAHALPVPALDRPIAVVGR